MGVIGTAVLTGLAGAAATSVLGEVFKKDAPPAPVAPTPEKPTVMPTENAPTMAAARKKSLMDQAQRQGRASTILTSNQDTTDKLGG